MLRYFILLLVPIIVMLTALFLSRLEIRGPRPQIGIPEFLFLPIAFWPCCYAFAHPEHISLAWLFVHQLVGAQVGWLSLKFIDTRHRWSAPLAMSLGAWLAPVLGLYVIVMAKVFGYPVL